MPWVLYFCHLRKKAARQEEQDVEKNDHCAGSGINMADISALHCARITVVRVRGIIISYQSIRVSPKLSLHRAPNYRFFSNAFKRCFRLSGVLLKLCRLILGCAKKIIRSVILGELEYSRTY